MARFVKVTSAKNARKIQHSGVIRTHDCFVAYNDGNEQAYKKMPCVFAMPITRNYIVSHQWTAEMNRLWGYPNQMKAVNFQIPDDEIVTLRFYASCSEKVAVQTTAAEVCGYFYDMISQDNIEPLLGLEVLIHRPIVGDEIDSAHFISRVGWKEWPKHMVNFENWMNWRRTGETLPEGITHEKFSMTELRHRSKKSSRFVIWGRTKEELRSLCEKHLAEFDVEIVTEQGAYQPESGQYREFTYAEVVYRSHHSSSAYSKRSELLDMSKVKHAEWSDFERAKQENNTT